LQSNKEFSCHPTEARVKSPRSPAAVIETD
jgi:hypothetical protein